MTTETAAPQQAPQTPTQTSAPAAAAPAEGLRSFRDVMVTEMDEPHKATPPAPAREEKPTKEVDEDEDFDDDDEEDEEPAEAVEADDSDDEEEESDDDEESAEEESEDAEDEEGVFLKCKVNGKMKQFTKAQVMSMVASGAHKQETWTKKEQEFQTRAVALKNDGQKIEVAAKKLAPVWDSLQKKDIEGGLIEMAKIQGFSPLELRKQLREQMFPIFIQRLGINPDWAQNRLREMSSQNETLDTKETNEFLESELKNKNVQPSQEETNLEQGKEQVKAFQIQHGVSRDEMIYARDFCVRELCGGDPDRLTMEMVFGTALDNRTVKKAFSAIRSRKPSLAKDEKFVDRVISKAKKHPEWDVADLARYVGIQARKIGAKKQVDGEKQLTLDVSRKALSARPKSAFQGSSDSKKLRSFRDLDMDTLP